MPKVIPDLQNQILEVARRILLVEGYADLTIRRVSKECGIAVGTLYNYYENKAALAAHIMLDDWTETLKEMSAFAVQCHDLGAGLNGMTEILKGFTEKYRPAWMEAAAGADMGEYTRSYRGMLLGQLGERVEQLLDSCGLASLRRLSGLLVEIMLSSSMRDSITPEQIELLAEKLSAGTDKAAGGEASCRSR